MRDYTDITVLMDRSGSMSSIKESMETAFDNFIKEHKAVPSTKLTLVQFDDVNNQDVVYQGVPVGAVERLTLKPRGNTPLLDAFCKVIDNTGRRFANLSESERPDQVLIVVITDGQENCSRHFTRNNVYDKVTKQREDYKWQFVYLGANQDAFAEAASFGIPMNYTMHYRPSGAGTSGAWAGLSANTVSYTKSVGASRGLATPDSLVFNAEQRTTAEDNS